MIHNTGHSNSCMGKTASSLFHCTYSPTWRLLLPSAWRHVALRLDMQRRPQHAGLHVPLQGTQVQSKSVRNEKEPCQYLDLGCSEVRCARWPLAPALAGPFERVGSPLQADDILPLLKCCYLRLCGRELLQHKPMQRSVPATCLWAPQGLRTAACFQNFHAGLSAGARMRCL